MTKKTTGRLPVLLIIMAGLMVVAAYPQSLPSGLVALAADESETTAGRPVARVSLAEAAPAPRGTLTVEALKVSQSSPSFTEIDVRFTNTSAQTLDWWIVGVETYDKDGNYLGRGDGLVTDIAPGQSRVHPVLIETQANAINTWQVTLNTVRVYGSFENLARFYRLDVKVRQPTVPTKKTKA